MIDKRIIQTKYAGEAVSNFRLEYDIKKVCSWKCFSFGIHIDFRFKYVDFHIWNYFIHLGTLKPSIIPDELFDKIKKMQDDNRKKIDELLKDYHPLKI